MWVINLPNFLAYFLSYLSSAALTYKIWNHWPGTLTHHSCFFIPLSAWTHTILNTNFLMLRQVESWGLLSLTSYFFIRFNSWQDFHHCTYFSTFVKDYIKRISKGLNFCFHTFLFPYFSFRRIWNGQQLDVPLKTCATTQVSYYTSSFYLLSVRGSRDSFCCWIILRITLHES